MNEPISIIIIADNYANALEKNLPGVLAQRYEPGFEVIVVRESRKGETIDVLKPLMAKHDNLSTTYLPDKPQYITDAEVAIMLGTKAAKNDHIVIIHPTFEVASENWLTEASDAISFPVVIGKAHYHHKQGFFSRHNHRRKSMKLLRNWCNDKSYQRKEICLDKHSRELFNIAYSQKLYMDDLELRHLIYYFTNP